MCVQKLDCALAVLSVAACCAWAEEPYLESTGSQAINTGYFFTATVASLSPSTLVIIR